MGVLLSLSRVEKTMPWSWESSFKTNEPGVFADGNKGESSGKSAVFAKPVIIKLPCGSVAAAVAEFKEGSTLRSKLARLAPLGWTQ